MAFYLFILLGIVFNSHFNLSLVPGIIYLDY